MTPMQTYIAIIKDEMIKQNITRIAGNNALPILRYLTNCIGLQVTDTELNELLVLLVGTETEEEKPNDDDNGDDDTFTPTEQASFVAIKDITNIAKDIDILLCDYNEINEEIQNLYDEQQDILNRINELNQVLLNL